MKILSHLCFLTVITLISSGQPKALALEAQEVSLIEVAPGIVIREGNHAIVFEGSNVANIGAILGEDCIAIIDTGGSIAEGRALRAAVEKLSNAPICYVINTHGHPDHFLGNAAFSDIEELQIVGHVGMAQSSAAARETWLSRLAEQQQKPVAENIWQMPDLTVADSKILDLGGRKIELTAVQTAHSFSDLTIYDETTGSLWLSDLLFVEHVPVLAGSLLGWIEALEELSLKRVERLIPGHGPTSIELPSQAIALQQRYLNKIRSKSLSQIDAGISLFDAQQSAKKSNSAEWKLFQQYHARNIARAWGELEWVD